MLFAAQAYSAITRYFAHWEGVPGLDFEQSFEAYVRAIAGNDSRRDFDMATLKLVAGLNNGHTDFQDPWLQSHSGAAIGINVQHRSDGWIVITSQRQGIRPGDRITEIDGAPFEEFYNSLAAYIPASSDRARRNRLSSMPILWPQRFRLTLDSGEIAAIDRTTVLKAVAGDYERTDMPEAYWRLPSFAAPRYEQEALQFVEENAGKPALIIDVRGNGGGSTPAHLIGALMGDWTWPASAERIQHTAAEASASVAPRPLSTESKLRAGNLARALSVKPAERRTATRKFDGRLLILADANCASACEDFLLAIKARPRTTLIGETSAGTTGQPFFYIAQNGMRLRVGARRTYMAPGQSLEGNGIAPDISLQPPRDALLSGDDIVLKRALELLR
jgi:carboxyl-terminal processing protease